MSATPPTIKTLSWPRRTFTHILRVYARRETIRFLTTSELKSRHRDKVLGHLWSILDPLLFMLVYYFVFGVLFRAMRGGGRPVDFMLYILIGILVYRFLESTISQASTTIRTNRGIIQEISFPKAVFPISLAFSRLYDFAWGLIILFVFLLFAGVWPTVQYVWAPLLLFLTLLFTTGAALMVASLGAFFADTTNIVSVGMRLLFYVSPIFYFVRDRGGHSALIHNETARFWYFLNPIAGFLECWRDVLLWGVPPSPGMLGYVAVVAVATAFMGLVVFSAGEGQFAKYV